MHTYPVSTSVGSDGVGKRQRLCLPVLLFRGGEVPQETASHSVGCLALYLRRSSPLLCGRTEGLGARKPHGLWN